MIIDTDTRYNTGSASRVKANGKNGKENIVYQRTVRLLNQIPNSIPQGSWYGPIAHKRDGLVFEQGNRNDLRAQAALDGLRETIRKIPADKEPTITIVVRE